LASISATPGHTKEFHFYAVNKNRHDIQSFYLVDVPGLGFAQVNETKIDSWRNLIERYLVVRSTLQVQIKSLVISSLIVYRVRTNSMYTLMKGCVPFD
jgi:GTP-binding protein EngB required for normal cell division